MTNTELIILLVETARAIADPENGMEVTRENGTLVLRLLEAAKEIHELSSEILVAGTA